MQEQAVERLTQAIGEELFGLAVSDPWNKEKFGDGFLLCPKVPAVLDFSEDDGVRYIAVYTGDADVENFMLSQVARQHGSSDTRIRNLDLNKHLVVLCIENGKLDSVITLEGRNPGEWEPTEDELADTLAAVKAASVALRHDAEDPDLGAFVDEVSSPYLPPAGETPEASGYFEIFSIPFFFSYDGMVSVPSFGVFVSPDGQDISLYAVETGKKAEVLIPTGPSNALDSPDIRSLRIRDPRSAFALAGKIGPDFSIYACREEWIAPLDEALDMVSDVLTKTLFYLVDETDDPICGNLVGSVAASVVGDPLYGRVDDEELIKKYVELNAATGA